jgi:hypothetical protein
MEKLISMVQKKNGDVSALGMKNVQKCQENIYFSMILFEFNI